MATTRPGDTTHQTGFTGTYSKLITEQLGIRFKDGLSWLERSRTSSVSGAQNFHLVLQYEPIINQPHEFVLSVQVDQEFGGTGSRRVKSSSQSATTPGVTFAKGLGDLPIGYWRPLAITGFVGYQAAQGTRTSTVQAGFSIQYSMPYLLSKVANVDLPPFLRGMTPITEVMYMTPARGRGQGTTLVVAPGMSYSEGKGWEAAIEAMIPATRATGHGVGVIAQLVLQLDYLLPDSVFGRPIFRPR
jgi:hypothetical protein